MSLLFRRIVLSRSLLIFTLLCFSLNVTVSAALVTTYQTVNTNLSQQLSSKNTDITMNRDILAQQLVAFGVAPEQVQSRLDSMSDSEIAVLSSEIADLPAGGEVLTILALAFFVLLFTDIAGYTDLFPFVNKKSKMKNKPQSKGQVDDRSNNKKRTEPLVIEN